MTIEAVSRLLKIEHLLSEHFSDARCVNISWCILLALYEAHRENRKLDISGVCLAVPAPMTTVMRRIDRLHRIGLINRVPDRSDGRRTFIVLAPDALAKSRTCLQAVLQVIDFDSEASR